MKCEICKTNDAETAITVERDGKDDELYVCRACASKERARRQKKSMRTRNNGATADGFSVSLTKIEAVPGNPPPFLKAILDAVGEAVIGPAREKAESGAAQDGGARGGGEDAVEVAPDGVDAKYLVMGRLHLEGLYLLGEIEPACRAFRAMRMELCGIGCSDTSLKDPGHAYSVRCRNGSEDKARKAMDEIVRQERFARTRLLRELPRVYGDSVCRALAVLKNCRMLSPAELLDLLSPIRLAAMDRLVEGITFRKVESMIGSIDLSPKSDYQDESERDEADAAFADETNGRFENVILSEKGERLFQ